MDLNTLVQKITNARAIYYSSGNSVVEDALYDSWEEQLKKLDPSHPLLSKVGASENILNKVKHIVPMGSLNKAMNQEEFYAWMKKVPYFVDAFNVSYKMDGGSVSLKYVNGKLVQAVSRGDGEEGEDITHNALNFHSLPKDNVIIAEELFSGYIRGELILENDKWLEVDSEQTSNPRNLAVGLSKRKDNTEAKFLTIYAFSLYDLKGNKEYGSDNAAINHMGDAGFKIPVTKKLVTACAIWDFIQETEKVRNTLNYWIDGIVVSMDEPSIQKTFKVEENPEWAVAVKFAARTYPTTLLRVEFHVGHTGKVVPVGHFSPVIIDGTTVEKALLCNSEVIAGLDIAVGDIVSIYKAGDIIPRVLEVLERPANRQPIVFPTHCPVCGTPLVRRQNISGQDSADWFCMNEDCKSKTFGKIMRYIKSLDIKEIGDTLVLELLESKMIFDISDLYILTEDDLANFISSSGRKFGRSNAIKVIENISAKRELTIPQLLGSIGVFQLGKDKVKNIMEAAPDRFENLSDWFIGKLCDPVLAKKVGLPNSGAAIQKSIMDKNALVEKMLQNGVYIKAKIAKPVAVTSAAPKQTYSFCMTGTLSKTRNEIVADIENSGHTFISDVKKGLDYLVIADPSSSSSKAVKARKLGIKIISETELYNLLKQ